METIKSRNIHAVFAWQARFHNPIIRKVESHEKIRNYVINNSQKWKEDTFYN